MLIFGGTVYPNPCHDTKISRWKTCQDANRRDGLPIQTSPSGSHSRPIQNPGAACATIRRYLGLEQTCDPLEADGFFCFQKKDSASWTLFLKWYHSLAKSLPGKEKGNLITNTSFLKFEVCFEVEDHHGTYKNYQHLHGGSRIMGFKMLQVLCQHGHKILNWAEGWTSFYLCHAAHFGATMPPILLIYLLAGQKKGEKAPVGQSLQNPNRNDAMMQKKNGGVQNLQTSKSSGRLFNIPTSFPKARQDQRPSHRCLWLDGTLRVEKFW